MELAVAGLVLLAAALHPVRELILKGNPFPESAYFAMMLVWFLAASAEIALAGHDLAVIGDIWAYALVSALSLLAYYGGIIVALRQGDLSVYYPIIRSTPVFIVLAGFAFLGYRFSPTLLLGIALVTVGAFFLQFRRGACLFDNPAALAAALLAMAGSGTQSLVDAVAMAHTKPSVLLFAEYAVLVPIAALWFTCRRPPHRSVAAQLFGGWRYTPLRYLAAGGASYLSYYLILKAYLLGGNVAAVNGLRQASIPLSVMLGGLVLKEAHLRTRLIWATVLGAGIAVTVLAR